MSSEGDMSRSPRPPPVKYHPGDLSAIFIQKCDFSVIFVIFSARQHYSMLALWLYAIDHLSLRHMGVSYKNG